MRKTYIERPKKGSLRFEELIKEGNTEYENEVMLLKNSIKAPDFQNEWNFHFPNEIKEAICSGVPDIPKYFISGLSEDIQDIYRKSEKSYIIARNNDLISSYELDVKDLMKFYGNKDTTHIPASQTKYADIYEAGREKAASLYSKEALSNYLNNVDKTAFNEVNNLEQKCSKLDKALHSKQKYWKKNSEYDKFHPRTYYGEALVAMGVRGGNKILSLLNLLLVLAFIIEAIGFYEDAIPFLSGIRNMISFSEVTIASVAISALIIVGFVAINVVLIGLINNIFRSVFDILPTLFIQRNFNRENAILDKRNAVREQYLNKKKEFCTRYPMFIVTENVNDTMKYYKAYIRNKKDSNSVSAMYENYIKTNNPMCFSTKKLNIM